MATAETPQDHIQPVSLPVVASEWATCDGYGTHIVETDKSVTVDNMIEQLAWHVNRIRRLILVNGKYRLISKQSRAHVRELKAAVKSLKVQNGILLEQITAHTETVLHDTSTIANLESEIRGLEHTNALLTGIIDQQTAWIERLEAQLASLAPAMKISAADNLG